MFRTLSLIAAGAAAMLLLDPKSGARRRALIRDRIVRSAHALQAFGVSKAGHLGDRTRGLAAEARGAIRRDRPGDAQLDARVRARLGREASHPHAIRTEAHAGVVTLAGVAPAEEIDAIVAKVASVRGVERVDNRLEAGDPSREAGAPKRRPAARTNGHSGAG